MSEGETMYIHEAVKIATEQNCFIRNSGNGIRLLINLADGMLRHTPNEQLPWDSSLWNPQASDLMSDEWETYREHTHYVSIPRPRDMWGEVIKVENKDSKMREQIEKAFVYHTPKGNQPARYTAIRAAAKGLAVLIDESCPDSREKSLAITKLEECVMWANASIARNE
jgi:hypothetical protein